MFRRGAKRRRRDFGLVRRGPTWADVIGWVEHLDNYLLAEITVIFLAADEVEQAWMVEFITGVTIVWEKYWVRAVAIAVVFFTYHHHRVILVLKIYDWGVTRIMSLEMPTIIFIYNEISELPWYFKICYLLFKKKMEDICSKIRFYLNRISDIIEKKRKCYFFIN